MRNDGDMAATSLTSDELRELADTVYGKKIIIYMYNN